MSNDLPPPPDPLSESTLFADLTAEGRDPARDAYRRLAGTPPASEGPRSDPSGANRMLPPWKVA